MKEYSSNRNKLKNSKYQKPDIFTIGSLLNIETNEIRSTLRKKKIMVLIGLIILIISLLSGCIGPGGRPGYHYGAICIQDFSWIWRLF